MDYLLQRLSEKTTWTGLFTVAGAVTGTMLLSPELAAAVATAAASVAAAVLIFIKERKTGE